MALATMLGKARILQIAAISTATILRGRQRKLTSIAADDENLNRPLQDGIDEAPKVPVGFPFEIQDEPGSRKVIFQRKYGGDEVVRIEVDNMARFDEDDVDEDDVLGYPAVATVTKHAYGQLLSFKIEVFDDQCNSASIFNAYYVYLKARGIEDDSTSIRFLFDYIDYTNKRDSLILADKVKNFVLN
ncbi:hypothetical protein LINPERHAP1_LOCUS37194 [Linum perenne]